MLQSKLTMVIIGQCFLLKGMTVRRINGNQDYSYQAVPVTIMPTISNGIKGTINMQILYITSRDRHHSLVEGRQSAKRHRVLANANLAGQLAPIDRSR